MTDRTPDHTAPIAARSSLLNQTNTRTRARHASERRFRALGMAAIAVALLSLIVLVSTILGNGLSAFRQTTITLPVTLDASALDKSGERDIKVMKKVTTIGYGRLLSKALAQHVKALGLNIEGMTDKDIFRLLSKEAPATLRNKVLANPNLIGQEITVKFLANGRVDGFFKGRVTLESAELDRNISPAQLELAQALKEAGFLKVAFNPDFLLGRDASELRPEAAGLGIAILGSAYMMLVVVSLALPIGVASSIYLEEFAPQNRLTDIIDVNISNLAAVPSIVFGILGLAVFINFIGLPQSAPIVGGLVLTLMTLPTIIIATRAAIKAVPPSIRDAALGIGASKMQTVFHHVLPMAMPGILTGTILGLAQALGETAPLLLIGMVAFVREFPSAPPEGLFEPAAALPVQVFNFTQRADPAFVERASGAIIVLLGFLLLMNITAIILRRRFERRS